MFEYDTLFHAFSPIKETSPDVSRAKIAALGRRNRPQLLAGDSDNPSFGHYLLAFSNLRNSLLPPSVAASSACLAVFFPAQTASNSPLIMSRV